MQKLKGVSALICVLSGAGLMLGCQSMQQPEGALLFQQHCASCHGTYAEGDGPASVDVGLPIPDLRYLAQSNAGVFPEDLVYRVIDGQTDDPAHYARRMPVWGYELSLREGDTEEAVAKTREKISALTDYLESIQQP